MRIQRVERFEVDGREFPSVEKAQDYVDGEVNRILQRALGSGVNGLTTSQVVKVTEAILERRVTLGGLLLCQMNPEEN